MKYLSVCSGIEAASVAWHPLGWTPLAFSEIEPFPRAVLAHHYPDVPCHGDFTKLRDEPWIVDADVLVGGTPCQAFSVAGLRKSLDDDRGNLSLEFVRLADAIDDLRTAGGRDPSIIVWENVPGVLSVKDNAFGCFLAGLAGDVAPYVPPRGKWTNAGVVDGPQRKIAWRVLDAQYFGLAQRRRRVFVVASARAGFDPAAVLFEFKGVRRDTPPRREAGKAVAAGAASRAGERSHWDGVDNPHPTLNATATHGVSNQELFSQRGAYLVGDNKWPADIAPTLNASFGDKQGLEDQHIRGGVGSLYPPISQCLNAGGMGRQDAETETLIPTIGCVFDEVAVNVCPTLRAGGNQTGGDRPPGTDVDTADSLIVTHSPRSEGFDASEDGTGRGTPLVPVLSNDPAHAICANEQRTYTNEGSMFQLRNVVAQPVAYSIMPQNSGKDYKARKVEVAQPIMAGGPVSGNQGGDYVVQPKGDAAPCVAVAFEENFHAIREVDVAPAMTTEGYRASQNAGGLGLRTNMAVRRLTPTECERLQGFPDDYTMIPWKKKPASECPDGPRYKALGNSMAVPCMRWIGKRIAEALK